MSEILNKINDLRFTSDSVPEGLPEAEVLAVVDILSKRKRSPKGRTEDSFPTVILDTLERLGSATISELETAVRNSAKKAVRKEKEKRGDDFKKYVLGRVRAVIKYYLDLEGNNDPTLPEPAIVSRLIDEKEKYSLLFGKRITNA